MATVDVVLQKYFPKDGDDEAEGALSEFIAAAEALEEKAGRSLEDLESREIELKESIRSAAAENAPLDADALREAFAEVMSGAEQAKLAAAEMRRSLTAALADMAPVVSDLAETVKEQAELTHLASLDEMVSAVASLTAGAGDGDSVMAALHKLEDRVVALAVEGSVDEAIKERARAAIGESSDRVMDWSAARILGMLTEAQWPSRSERAVVALPAGASAELEELLWRVTRAKLATVPVGADAELIADGLRSGADVCFALAFHHFNHHFSDGSLGDRMDRPKWALDYLLDLHKNSKEFLEDVLTPLLERAARRALAADFQAFAERRELRISEEDVARLWVPPKALFARHLVLVARRHFRRRLPQALADASVFCATVEAIVDFEHAIDDAWAYEDLCRAAGKGIRAFPRVLQVLAECPERLKAWVSFDRGVARELFAAHCEERGAWELGAAQVELAFDNGHRDSSGAATGALPPIASRFGHLFATITSRYRSLCDPPVQYTFVRDVQRPLVRSFHEKALRAAREEAAAQELLQSRTATSRGNPAAAPDGAARRSGLFAAGWGDEAAQHLLSRYGLCNLMHWASQLLGDTDGDLLFMELQAFEESLEQGGEPEERVAGVVERLLGQARRQGAPLFELEQGLLGDGAAAILQDVRSEILYEIKRPLQRSKRRSARAEDAEQAAAKEGLATVFECLEAHRRASLVLSGELRTAFLADLRRDVDGALRDLGDDFFRRHVATVLR